jgi:6-hydroxytryprostatin B O-methyltransferase
MPRVQESFEKSRPAELKSRATYQIHSFFDPQPVKGADVYFLRGILHDWPDADAIKIARQLVPAMGPNSRIVLFENVMPEFEDGSNALMHLTCALDMKMMATFNSRERTKTDWIELMKKADERLTLKKFTTPAGSALTGLVFGLN